MDKDYKLLWEDSIKENKELEEENTNLANEKYDLELEMGSLVMKNKQLEDDLNSKEKCNNELKNKITSLEEIINNYRKGIEDANIQLAEFKGIEQKFKGEIANLKQILKAVTYLLQNLGNKMESLMGYEGVKLMDLNEVAKQYTRKDFLNMTNKERGYVLHGKNCPTSHGFSTANCRDFNINDYNCANLCWKLAIKNIKFKDEVWVKCINDLGSKDLTLNKEYMVTSQGTVGIEVVNDSDKKYTYLVDAFETIKKDKEIKETKTYNFRDVITNIKPKEQYECEGFKIKCCDDETIEIYNRTTDTRIGFYKYDTFAKIEPKAVKFTEVVNSDKKCRVEHELIDKLISVDDEVCDFDFTEFMEIDEVLFEITNQYGAEETRDILLNGKWYLEQKVDEIKYIIKE